MNGSGEAPRSNRLMIWAALPSAFILTACALSLLGSSTPNHTPPPLNPTSTKDQHFPLEISPDPLWLGSLSPGRTATGGIEVRNPGGDAITVVQVDTSCPCLVVSSVPARVGPRENAHLTVRFDPTEDVDFRGKLSIQLTGYGAGERLLFRTHVRLEVKVSK